MLDISFSSHLSFAISIETCTDTVLLLLLLKTRLQISEKNIVLNTNLFPLMIDNI